MRHLKKEKIDNNGIWIISEGRYADTHYEESIAREVSGPVMEYMISDLAMYLLNPYPINVRKKLIGCEVRYHKSFIKRILSKIKRILSSGAEEGPYVSELIISDYRNREIPLQDKGLKHHVDKIQSMLRLYNPMLKRLADLDMEWIYDVIGICEEDIDGNRSYLTLKGDIEDKVKYISGFAGQDVDVILERPFVAEGVFEMRGYDFLNFNAALSYRLIKYRENGVIKCCVLNSDNHVEYRIEDITLFHHMQLLEQTIKSNAEFKASFELCLEGNARPLRLLFNKQLSIDYTRSNLPVIYKNVFEKLKLGLDEKEAFLELLRQFQFGITFQCIPKIDTGEEKLFTSISVMHDVKALEPLKAHLPQLYSEINSLACTSEIGKFYLLDSIRGFKHE